MAKNPPSRGGMSFVTGVMLLALSGLALWQMRLGEVASLLGEQMQPIIDKKSFPGKDIRLRLDYTNLSHVDFGLRYLVAAFLPGVAGWDKSFQMQQIYFLVSFFTIIAIWSIEAGRLRSRWTVTFFTSAWGVLYQTVGGAVIIPLYYFAFWLESAQSDYYSPVSRYVRQSYAKSLLPALLVGYLLPTGLMFLPPREPSLSITQGLIALWQFVPILVNTLLMTEATYANETSDPNNKVVSHTDDLKYLDRVYLVSFLSAAGVHVWAVLTCLLADDPRLSLVRTLGLLIPSRSMSMAEALHYIFQVDYWIIFLAALWSAFFSLVELKRLGLARLSLSQAAVGMVVASTTIGPAATIAGVWYLREHIMVQSEKKKA